MGEKRIKVRFCDHCGTDSQPISAHTLGWDRKRWSLDLCARCTEELERYLYSIPGIDQRGGESKTDRPAPYKAAEGVDLGEVRRWAIDQGISVSKRGRIAADVIERWRWEKGEESLES
jgi:hypothetical protein